jgi:hypothetical protein
MDFVPEKSALEADETRADKEIMETLAFMPRWQRSECKGCTQ